jgi:hypothetical protein
MMNNIKLLTIGSVCLSLLLLSGCVMSPAKPRAFASLGQFEQYQLNTAIFRVSFRGDPDMSQGTAEEITLLKTAKTTVEAGYRYFSVVNESKPRPRRTVVYPDYPPFGFYGHRRWPYGFYNDPFYSSTVYNIDPVEVSYTIHCSKAPSSQKDEFDAQLILASLGPKYYLNADGSARVIETTPVKP